MSSSAARQPPSYDDTRQQAGPLPSKRGELGFIEGVHEQSAQQVPTIIFPARHPADTEDDEPPTTAIPLTPSPNAASTHDDGSTAVPSSDSPEKQNAFLKFLKPKKIAAFQGLRLVTLLAFLAQFLVFSACLVAWAFTGRKLASLAKEGGTGLPGGLASVVFVHVVFCFAVVGQLIFLERRVYRLRAERYSFLHPGEMLPRYRDRVQPGGDLSFAYAPWNRPPLPTYAAVLAQSGYGTGDVDDHLIAVPPPPAYGNTRGSTLLLSGFLRDSLRVQRPPSVHSQQDLERGGSTLGGNAVSHRESHLQQTLAQLERTRR